MPSFTPERGFLEAEYLARLERAQRLMAGDGLDGLLVMSEPEVRYFSGFKTQFWQSPTRPWFVFVPANGKPIAIIPEIGAALMGETWLDDIRTWHAPDPDDDGVSLLLSLLAPLAAAGKTIGILKGPETRLFMPLADFERLVDGLPGLNIADATPVVRALRMIKSEAEIEKIGHIGQIASATFAKAPSLFAVGQPMIEAFRAFKVELLRQGADDVPYLVGGAGENGYAGVISPPTNRALQTHDVFMLDTGAVFDGYFCDFDRNFAIGSASEEVKTVYRTLLAAANAGLEAARPGVACNALFSAMQSVIEDAGFGGGSVGRFGHGLGTQLTEWPSLAPFDDTILQENMVITLEPSIGYGDGKVMVHEENIVIRDGRPQLLNSAAPEELVVIGGRNVS